MSHQLVLATVCIAIQCGCSSYEQSSAVAISPSLHNLTADVVPLLRQLPHVEKVERLSSPSLPRYRIIHIADWHFVPKEAYAADLQSQSDALLSDVEIANSYSELLDEVEAIQREQMVVLRLIAKQHGVRYVYVEGLADGEEFIFNAKVSALRKVSLELDELREEEQLLASGKPDAETQKIINGIENIRSQHRSDLLHLGAAGRLILAGDLDGVLPLEDADAHAASNPVGDNGSVVFDHEKIEARQDAQARLLLAGDPVAIIILGGAHELSDNLERLSNGTAEYIRLELEAWEKMRREGE